MVDIQSPTAEIRRGKKKIERKIEETTGRKYNGLPYACPITLGGYNNATNLHQLTTHSTTGVAPQNGDRIATTDM